MAKYLDENGLLYVWGKIKNLLSVKQDNLTAGSHISLSGNTISASFSNATTSADGLMSKADKKKLDGVASAINAKANTSSPAFSGTPTAPTAAAGTKTTQIATTAFVSSAVAAALAGVTGIKFSIVTTLPDTGATGTFYLVAHSHSDSNDGYDEYVWLTDSGKFEKIGNTDVDLSGYVKTTDISAIANTEIDTICA